MDPDETLARLRELAEEPISLDVCEEMQQHFMALDDWLTRNGFLPWAWWQKEEHETRPAPDFVGEYEAGGEVPC